MKIIQNKMCTKVSRYFMGFIFSLMLNSCGIYSYSTYGKEFFEKTIITDSNFQCVFYSNVDTDSDIASMEIDFLKVKNKYSNQQIDDIHISYSWNDKKRNKIIPQYQPSFYCITSNPDIIFNNCDCTSFKMLPDEFKNISDFDEVAYCINFKHKNNQIIPIDIKSVVFEIIIYMKNGKTYTSTVKLKRKTHYRMWFLRND